MINQIHDYSWYPMLIKPLQSLLIIFMSLSSYGLWRLNYLKKICHKYRIWRIFLQHESRHKRETVRDNPKQSQSWDCGLFICCYGEHLSRNAPLAFEQNLMKYFSYKDAYEIQSMNCYDKQNKFYMTSNLIRHENDQQWL